MANLRKVIYINEEDYSTLINGDSLVIDGTTYTYEENALYVIKNAGPPEYAETAGYATNAGTSLVAVTDASGNNIAATYGKKPLIIEIERGDASVQPGTYNNIKTAITNERNVIIKYNDINEFRYLPLVYDGDLVGDPYMFCSSNEYRFDRISIYDDDTYDYFNGSSAPDDSVVHILGSEIITGNKTFTGTVSLGSNATATTPAATDNDTSVATTAFVHNVVNAIPEITTGQIVGRMHRDNVSGTGNLTITGASGEGFSPNGITTAGKYVVVVYSWSDTKTFGYNISFGSNSYTLSTTDGTISDKRELTVSAGALWSVSVTTAVSAGTTIIVEIYKAEKTTPALSVGTAALTNLYNDLDGKPTISDSTSSTSSTDIASSKAVKLAYDHGGVQSVNGQTGDVEVVVPQSLLLKGITPQGHTLADAADSYYTNELNNGEAGAWFISYSNGDILVKSSNTSKDQDGRVCLSSSWKSRLNYGGMTWANVGDILLVYKQSSLIVVYKVMSINEAGETRIGLMSPNDKIQVNKISNIEGNVNNLLGKIDKRLPYSTDSTNIGNAGNGAYTNVTAGRTNWLDTSTAGAAIKLGNLQIAIDNSGRLYSRNQTNNIWNVTNQLKTITETDLNNVFEPSVIGYATVTNGPSETGNYTVYTLTSSDYDGNGFRSILQIAINRNSGNQYMRTCFKKVDGSGTDFTSTDWKLVSPSVTSVNGQTGAVTITETQLSKGTATGTGNAITDINVSNHQITLVKGATYATQSDIDTSIANLVDSAPETLDTLNELAAALGDDPNFATTVATQIGNKADKSNMTAGTYRSVTVNNQGIVTGGTNPTTLAGYGITDAINTSSTAQTKAGNLTAAKFITSGGNSSQFVKGDGSLDSNTYMSQKLLESRGENLIYNGNGFMRDNTNFPSFVFDQTECNGSIGSFKLTGSVQATCTYSIPVSPSLTYMFRIDGKQSEQTKNFYALLDCYDVDGREILPEHYYWKEAEKTELTQDLVAGDTVIHLANISDEWLTTGATCGTVINFWNYTNSKGYTFPPYTYTRNYLNYGSYDAIDRATNTITLSVPYSGDTIPAGTKVSRKRYGGTYLYLWNGKFNSDWTTKTSILGGINTSGWADIQNGKHVFRPGTSFVKLGFLVNWSGANTQTTWITNISFSANDAGMSLPLIGGTLTGSIKATSFKKTGGTSSQFLKADGSVDSNTYLTQSTLNSGNPDLAAIEALSGTSGLLKKTAANTWTLDTNAYLTQATFNSGNPDLAAIEALSGTSGILKKTANNTWVLDTNTYLTSFTETDPTVQSWAKKAIGFGSSAYNGELMFANTFMNNWQNNGYVISLKNEENNAVTNIYTSSNIISNNGERWNRADDYSLLTAKAIKDKIDIKYTKPSAGIPASDLADGVIPDEKLSSSYQTSTLENDNLLLAGGDTYETAFSKIEKAILDNEETIAASLNDLNTRKIEISDIPTKTSQLTNDSGFLTSHLLLKTINNESLIGSGNITIQGGSGGDTNVIETIKVNGTALTPDSNKAVDITAIPASIVTEDSTHKFATNAEKTKWNTLSNVIDVPEGPGLTTASNTIMAVGVSSPGYGIESNAIYIKAPTGSSDANILKITGNGIQTAVLNGGSLSAWTDYSTNTLTPNSPLYIQQGTGSSSGITYIKLTGNMGTDISYIIESSDTSGGWEHAGDAGIPTIGLVYNKVSSKYTKPSTGIPKTDLASAVQTSLGLADTALQSFTEEDPVFSASVAAGISSSDITTWNDKVNRSGDTINGTLEIKPTGSALLLNTTNLGSTAVLIEAGRGDSSDYHVITRDSNDNLIIGDTGHLVNLVTGSKVGNKTIATTDLIPTIPTNVSTFTNDAGYLTSFTETDPTVPAWAKAANKPTYTAAEVGALPDTTVIPTVNNATLTIQKNGTTVNTFTANASSNVTANILVNELPTVSSSDNGKVLMVVNGAWAAVTPVTVYTGTSTPNNSLGNNGDLYVLTS